MAVRFSADGQDFTRTSGGHVTMAGPWTVCCWAKISTDRNTYSTIWEFGAGANPDWEYLQTGSDGTSIVMDSGGGTSIAGPNMTVGSWYFLAVVKSGTGSNQATLYHAVSTAASLTSVTGTLGVSTAISTIRIGESFWAGEWLNGCVAAFKIFDSALSQAQVENERWFYTPQIPAFEWHPFLAGGAVAEAQTDYSGNGRTLSAGTSSSTEGGPPIAWRRGPSRIWIPAAASGGATIQVGAGSLSLAGQVPTVLSPRTTIPNSGSLALSGFAAQLLSRIAIGAGALSLTGHAPVAVAPHSIPVSPGALALNGQAPAIEAGNAIAIGAGAVALNGQSPVASAPYSIPINVGALSLTGQSPTVVAPYTIPVPAGAITATGYTSALDSLIRISPGSLTLNGQVPAIDASNTISVGAGALTLTGFAASISTSADRTVEPVAGSMSLAGHAPPLLMVIPLATASLTMTGNAPTATAALRVPIGAGELSLNSIAPALLHSIAVGLGQMLLNGQVPSVVNPVTVQVSNGALLLTGTSPTVDVGADVTVLAGTGNLVLSGHAIDIVAPQVIAILPGSMLLNGQIPGVDLSNIFAVVIQMRPAATNTASAQNKLQSNLTRMRHDMEIQ